MQTRSNSRWGMGRGRGTACATTLLGLWSTVNNTHVSLAMSSGNACPTEAVICAADEVCNVCLETLGSLSTSSLGLESTSVDCQEWFLNLCNVVGETVCDAANDNFIALAACIVEDTNGCTGFTTCEEVLSASPAPSIGADTSAPTARATAAALTESPTVATTAAPTASDEATNAADATSAGFELTTSVATTLGLVSGVALLLAV